MNIEELESVVDAMAEEGGDQIDALYDTVTLNKDTYCGFICRLREVVRLAKNEQEKSAPVGNAAAMRAVLVKCADIINNFGLAEAVNTSMEVICDIEGVINAALLAAPPRNCDRFRDWDSAAAEYDRLVQEGKAEDGTWCEWLFSVGQYAPAKKGGEK